MYLSNQKLAIDYTEPVDRIYLEDINLAMMKHQE